MQSCVCQPENISCPLLESRKMQFTRTSCRNLWAVPTRLPRRTVLVVRADASIEDLLARDRKQPKLNSELLVDTKNEKKQGAVVKTRQQRRSDGRARSEAADQPSDRPKRCKEAIDKGLEAFKQKQYDQAIALFNLALELPGNGAYRLPSSPREYSCASDAEEQAALYNMACAYAQLGQISSCLTCLEAVLESGFEDYATLRSDPDLAPARGAALDELLGRYDGPLAKLRKMLPGGKDKQALVSDTNKPWVLW